MEPDVAMVDVAALPKASSMVMSIGLDRTPAVSVWSVLVNTNVLGKFA